METIEAKKEKLKDLLLDILILLTVTLLVILLLNIITGCSCSDDINREIAQIIKRR
jgi:hypothetical protein